MLYREKVLSARWECVSVPCHRLRGDTAWEYRTLYGLQGNSILELCKTYHRMFREKGRDRGGLGRKNLGKTEGQGAKRGQSHVNRWLVSRLVWPCPALDQHSLSCVLTKLHFYFPECRALFCVYGCLRGQQLSGTTGSQGPLSVVLATGVGEDM